MAIPKHPSLLRQWQGRWGAAPPDGLYEIIGLIRAPQAAHNMLRQSRVGQPAERLRAPVPMNETYIQELRQQMLADIVTHTAFAHEYIGKNALDPRVMSAMAQVPRHEFVPLELQLYAYADTPLPIGFDKTISQPFIVALMTDLLDPQETDVVLEIGTGLGYQAAILSRLVRKVCSIESYRGAIRPGAQAPAAPGVRQCRDTAG